MDIGILAVSKPRNGLLNVPLGERREAGLIF